MQHQTDLPLWRSLLYVPVNVPTYVEKAHLRGADAIILDLEDSIPMSEKDLARSLLRDAARQVSGGGSDVVVRINRPWRMALRDIEAAVIPEVQGLVITKVADAGHIRHISEVVTELESERGMEIGSTKFIVLIETADAYLQAAQIARADKRIVAMTLAAEDFSLSVGMEPEPEGLLLPKQQVLITARAAGILPLGFVGSVAQYDDLDAFRSNIRRSRRLGFVGGSCIHPSLVPILNEEFSPTADEIAQARRIIETYDAALSASRGSVGLDGKMLDVPVVERARNLLQRSEKIRTWKSG